MSRPENSDAISDKSKNFWKHLQVKNDTGNGLRTKSKRVLFKLSREESAEIFLNLRRVDTRVCLFVY